MAYCRMCGSKINDGAMVCPSCGKPFYESETQNAPPVSKWAGDTFKQPFSSSDDKKNESSPEKAAKYTYSFPSGITTDEIILAGISYLGILVLLPILLKPDSKFVRFHMNQGVVLCLSFIACHLVLGFMNAFLLPLFGILGSMTFLILQLVWPILFVFMGFGVYNVLKGKMTPLPIIGEIKIL